MQGIERSEFDEVTDRVVRGFLRGMGWRPAQYAVFPVAPEAPCVGGERMVERARALAARPEQDPRRATEAFLRVAMFFDASKAGPEALQEALPTGLLDTNAIACLFHARALARTGRDEDARTELFVGMAVNPSLGAVRRELGLLLRRTGRWREATAHLEAAAELRNGLRLDVDVPMDLPLLVTETEGNVEIYFFKGRFYVFRRGPDVVGAVPIGGELFGVYRTLGFRVVRGILRIPALRPNLLKHISRIAVGRREPAAVGPQDDARRAGTAGPLPSSRVLARRGLAQQVALWLFARPIEQRADTMREALELARAAAEAPGPRGGARPAPR